MTDNEAVLKWFCEQDAAICNHPSVFSCTWAAESLKISVRRVRKIMKQLEADGYVVKAHEGGWDDWTGKLYCIHGYAVTKKAQDTDYWKDYYAAEVEWWENATKNM